MNLEEFKAHVEATRKASTLEAISKLSKADSDYVSVNDLFDQDDLLALYWETGE